MYAAKFISKLATLRCNKYWSIKAICVNQRCPTVILCLQQMWRINKAIRHIFYDLAKEQPIWQILQPGTSLFALFRYFQVWIKWKWKELYFLLFSTKKSLILRFLEIKPFATCGELDNADVNVWMMIMWCPQAILSIFVIKMRWEKHSDKGTKFIHLLWISTLLHKFNINFVLGLAPNEKLVVGQIEWRLIDISITLVNKGV